MPGTRDTSAVRPGRLRNLSRCPPDLHAHPPLLSPSLQTFLHISYTLRYASRSPYAQQATQLAPCGGDSARGGSMGTATVTQAPAGSQWNKCPLSVVQPSFFTAVHYFHPGRPGTVNIPTHLDLIDSRYVLCVDIIEVSNSIAVGNHNACHKQARCALRLSIVSSCLQNTRHGGRGRTDMSVASLAYREARPAPRLLHRRRRTTRYPPNQFSSVIPRKRHAVLPGAAPFLLPRRAHRFCSHPELHTR